MARKTKTACYVESLEGKALLSGLSHLAAASVTGPIRIGVIISIDPIPLPVNPATGSGATSSNGSPPVVVITNPDPIPLPVNPSAGSPATTSPPVSIALRTNHSAYRHGHPVHIKLTVTNTGTSPVSLSPSAIAKGLTVSHNAKVVWQPKHTGHNFSAQGLQPGQSIMLTAVWNGRPGHPGLYTIQESLDGATGSVTIRIT
jgi:hypothetical protein